MDPDDAKQEIKQFIEDNPGCSIRDIIQSLNFGAEIKMEKTHTEGKYLQQTRKLVNKLDMKTGIMNSWYEMDIPRVAFNIPFSNENVDKYPLNPHPFGPDSEIDITDPNQVFYYGKFEHQDNGTVAHRDGTYNYE